MRRRPLLTFLVLLAVAAVVALLLVGRGERPTLVDVEAVAKRAPFRAYVSGTGEIVAARYADIGSSVMGRLVALAVREGDRVTRGEVLARIDPVPAASDAQAAAAAFDALVSDRAALAASSDEAARALARARALHGEGVASQAELDQAVAAADAARAALEAAEKRVAEGRARLARARDGLAKTEITAPMDGVVTRLDAREGEMVVVGVQNQPGTILMTLSDLASIDAQVEIAEADVLRLAVGQAATVTLEALAGREFTGRVEEIGASALPVTGGAVAAREFRVVVRIDQPVAELRPGLTADARILVEERSEALTVPLQAVVLRAGPDGVERSGVFVVEGRRATFRPVATGIVGGLEVAVEGLPAGTDVVVGPYAALRELADGKAIKRRPVAR